MKPTSRMTLILCTLLSLVVPRLAAAGPIGHERVSEDWVQLNRSEVFRAKREGTLPNPQKLAALSREHSEPVVVVPRGSPPPVLAPEMLDRVRDVHAPAAITLERRADGTADLLLTDSGVAVPIHVITTNGVLDDQGALNLAKMAYNHAVRAPYELTLDARDRSVLVRFAGGSAKTFTDADIALLPPVQTGNRQPGASHVARR